MTIRSSPRYSKLSDNTVNTSLKKVYGPPGSGKTTWLIKYMEESGIPFERIAFVSFSKATISNLKARLNLDPNQSQYFRTIHSMNFYLLGVKREQMAHQHLATFDAKFSKEFLEAEAKKYEFTDGATKTANDTIDDDFYRQMMEERKLLLPRDYVPQRYFRNADLYLNFKERYFKWLRDNDYTDFIGLLEQGIAENKIPPVDLLCVDEWQDLSPLQVKQVTTWAQNIPLSVHAGDDDQTIHEWAGARNQDFLDFPTFTPTENKTLILNKTYRLPTSILDMSVSFIEKNKKRVQKNFTAVKTDSGIIEYTNIDKVADILREQNKVGTCKVLVRNNALKRYLIKDLTTRGIPTSSALQEPVKAIALVSAKKQEVTVSDLEILSENRAFHGSKHFHRGGKKEVAALSRSLSNSGEETIKIDELKNYKVKDILINALKTGDCSVLNIKQDFDTAVRVYQQFGSDFKPVEISSIHQAKGTEADTVVVCLDVVKKTYNESRLPEKIEEERRVWYVAMTRARKNLIFLRPTYRYFYPSPMTDYVCLYLKNKTQTI